jgi:hypothetical protein
VRAEVIATAKGHCMPRRSPNTKLRAPETEVSTPRAGLGHALTNRPVIGGDVVSQEPFAASMRQALKRDQIFTSISCMSDFTAELLRKQSRQHFG